MFRLKLPSYPALWKKDHVSIPPANTFSRHIEILGSIWVLDEKILHRILTVLVKFKIY